MKQIYQITNDGNDKTNKDNDKTNTVNDTKKEKIRKTRDYNKYNREKNSELGKKVHERGRAIFKRIMSTSQTTSLASIKNGIHLLCKSTNDLNTNIPKQLGSNNRSFKKTFASDNKEVIIGYFDETYKICNDDENVLFECLVNMHQVPTYKRESSWVNFTMGGLGFDLEPIKHALESKSLSSFINRWIDTVDNTNEPDLFRFISLLCLFMLKQGEITLFGLKSNEFENTRMYVTLICLHFFVFC